MIIVTVMLAVLPANMIEVAKLDGLKNPTVIIPLALLIPIAWVVAKIRKPKPSKNGGQNG